jgi:1-phosphofructokinase
VAVVVFAPSPVLTITIEKHGDQPDIHLHAGGQGVWQARMLVTLGAQVTLCAVLGGETGKVLRPLLEAEGVTVHHVEGSGRNGSYVHDRRGEARDVVAEAVAMPLSRHELDRLYDLTLSTSIDAGVVVLSGPVGDHTVPASVYRRLAADLHAIGRRVVVDLTGERLADAFAAQLETWIVMHEDLRSTARCRAVFDALVDAFG